MQMVDTLARRGREVLAAIDALWKRKGYGPSVREIGAEVGMKSRNTVHRWLVILAEAGYILRGMKGDHRAPRLTEKGRTEVATQGSAQRARERSPP